MKSGKCLFLVVLSVGVARAVSECSSKSEASYNTTVTWQCLREQSHTAQCKTFNDALDFSTNITASCLRPKITISLISKFETLEKKSTFITNATYYQVIGASNGTVVRCENSTLMFEGHEMSVEIRYMTFQNCGNRSAALTFSGVLNVTLVHVNVSESNGSGAAFQDIKGYVKVVHSVFHSNVCHGNTSAGVLIKMTTATRTKREIIFSNCTFSGNRGPQSSVLGGGGMTAAFIGDTENVSLVITSSQFHSNTAQYGAGLYVYFTGNATNNRLLINQTEFKNNYYVPQEGIDLYNVGGGAAIKTLEESISNKIHFQNCSFTNNNATWGGGLAIHAKPSAVKYVKLKNLNTYNISSCNFTKNRAVVGSAISLYCTSPPMAPELCNAIPTLDGSSKFFQNGQEIRFSSQYSYTSTESTLQISDFPTSIKADLSFEENRGSPIYVRNAVLVVKTNTVLNFSNNTAEIGAGIALYDSWMSVSGGCQLVFTKNTAFTEGGAIYAHHSADLYVPHLHSCFIRSNISGTPQKSSFYFKENMARNKTSSIYATSIIPCSKSIQDVKETFCGWKNWTFDDPENCTDQIRTSVTNLSSTPDSVTLSPGIPRKFVVGFDDLGHRAETLSIIPTVWPKIKGSNIAVNYTDDGLTVYAKRDINVTILIQMGDALRVVKKVSVNVGGCPPGFGFSSHKKSCSCFEKKRNILQCNENHTASLLNGYCISFTEINGIKQTVYGRCVFSAVWAKSPSRYISLPEREEMLNSNYCNLFNRAGRLCGECKNGSSIDIFSPTFSCHYNCTSAVGWIIFAAVNGIPPLLLFLAILILHIKFTSASMNGFIFFSHVITLSQEAIVIDAIANMQRMSSKKHLIDFLMDIYSFWSLDNNRIFHSFTDGHPICLKEQMRVIDVLALQYLSAVYPFLLVVMAYIVIELHARNCRVLVWLWKPLCFPCTRFRQSWKLQTSVVDAFASFILLSSVKLARISLLLISFTDVLGIEDTQAKVVLRVNNYDPTVVYLSRQHLPFVLLGTFFFITLSTFPPVLLLFYQCKLVQKCLNRCRMNRIGLKTFMDVFQGCYVDGKNGGRDRRFFAGLYLTFRVAIFLLFNLQSDHIKTYYYLVVMCILIICLLAWLQPYKVKFYNKLDIFFIALLAAFFGLHILGFVYVETTLSVPVSIIDSGAFLCCIPLLYMAGLVLTKMSRRCYRLVAPMKLRLLRYRFPLYNMVHLRNQCGGYRSAPDVTYSEVKISPHDETPSIKKQGSYERLTSAEYDGDSVFTSS